jgi:hypothetical protein
VRKRRWRTEERRGGEKRGEERRRKKKKNMTIVSDNGATLWNWGRRERKGMTVNNIEIFHICTCRGYNDM